MTMCPMKGTVVLVVIASSIVGGCGGSANEQEESVARTEQAVIVHLDPPRVDEDWGVDLVEDPLIDAIDDARVGEFDGNDVALDGTEVILYAYGPDADALYEVMEPILKAIPPGPKSYAIKRYGEPGAREVRIEL